MIEKEITKDLHLTEEQKSILDMHSFLNIMNVLLGELQLFYFESGEDPLLEKSIEISNLIKTSLSENSFSLISDEKFEEYKNFVLNSLETVFDKNPYMKANNDIDPNFENIQMVFKVLAIRLIEIRNRLNEPQKWDHLTIEDLESSLIGFFCAVEKNSNGKYKIIHNIAKQEEKDYLVEIKIESVNNNTVYMPVVFKDVIRDLSANARKYTLPGGEINIGIWDDDHKLTFVVQDNGKGIPDDEIDRVVDFGHRASNVKEQVTFGAGFGLTKAYFITKLHKGRMWIKSELGLGTKIRIEIPHPTK
jgi:signal transduction histidine kinase